MAMPTGFSARSRRAIRGAILIKRILAPVLLDGEVIPGSGGQAGQVARGHTDTAIGGLQN